MTVEDLVARFSEISADLHSEEILRTFANVLDADHRAAAKPSTCSQSWTPGNRAYMTLIAPMDVYRYSLSTRDLVVEQLSELVREQETSPGTLVDRMSEEIGK